MLGADYAGFAGGQRVGRLVFCVGRSGIGRSGAWRSGADASVHVYEGLSTADSERWTKWGTSNVNKHVSHLYQAN